MKEIQLTILLKNIYKTISSKKLTPLFIDKNEQTKKYILDTEI